jgi:hypothetical protein
MVKNKVKPADASQEKVKVILKNSHEKFNELTKKVIAEHEKK